MTSRSKAGRTQRAPEEMIPRKDAKTLATRGQRRAGVQASHAAESGARRPTKAALIQQMLRGAEGASVAVLIKATGWQAHTMRAALTRLRQAGHSVERSRSAEGETLYQIGAGPQSGSSDGGELAAVPARDTALDQPSPPAPVAEDRSVS